VTRTTARREAELRGESRYFSGQPCIRGHFALRKTSSGTCMECLRLADRERKRKKVAEGRALQAQGAL
jgi:hypothetical protein